MASTKIPSSIFLQALILILSFPGNLAQTDRITSAFSITDPEFILSPAKLFKLGFFTPENTTNRYLGVVYAASENTVLWVANRDKPMNDSSGRVTISSSGDLVLLNGANQTVWSTNATSAAATNTTAQIHDTGNLVLREMSTGNIVWDSFTHPTNVFVPSMRIIDNIKTGERVFVSSWKNESDPEVGSFTSGLRALSLPQIFVWKNGRPHWRSGPWNGQILIGIQDMYSPYLDGFSVVSDPPSGISYFTAPEQPFLMKIALNSSGNVEQTLWDDQRKKWDVTWVAPQNECEVYAMCGPFGTCNTNDSPICSCPKGFEPLDKAQWASGNWTGGCTRRTQSHCNGDPGGKGEGFLRLQYMKVPDFPEKFSARQEDECRTRCLSNCSCIAYAHDQNIGCMVWRETLIDMQQFSIPIGADLHIRVAASDLDDHRNRKLIIIIPVVVGVVCISISVFIAWCWMTRRMRKNGVKTKDEENNEQQALGLDSTAIVLKDDSQVIDIKDLPLYTFETLASATDQFHDDSKLGQGGFGVVYMAKLENAKEIAVKRLSAASGQGLQEFMNEVRVISKVQHRNLVRLLGCCIERDEKMLLYEYMPNKSLDDCLFDMSHPSQKILDWKKRISIIKGIARGLLYLHTESRLRIIHRDLKPSNVLLDADWNPKISDFGMARIFGANQDQDNTARVVGTYGYMAPEYAMEGLFSEKSDVYSFGVMMLELVSGKKNTHYYSQEWSLSLIGCAWKLWNENNGTAFADQVIANPMLEGDVTRCIHIALLCVQEFPKDRPSIQTVLSMLSREILDLPLMEQPLFAEKWSRTHAGSTQQPTSHIYSINELTVTELDGR